MCFAAAFALALVPIARASGLPPRLPEPPASGQTNGPAPLASALTVNVSDPENDNLVVRFYGRASGTTPPSDFTLIDYPDTQFYTSAEDGGLPGMFYAQTSWTMNQHAARNIRYAVQLGDCTQHGSNVGNPIEWMRADTAMSTLENRSISGRVDGLPYGVCVGNHDQIGGPWSDSHPYNQFFGISRFAGRDYYGGHYGTDNANWFELFDASGLEFLVVSLEFMEQPKPLLLHWADSVLKAYPTRRAIIASHYLLNLPPRPDTIPTFGTVGQAVYDTLKDNSNLMLMLTAHMLGESRRSDTYQGRTVHTVLANYQGYPRGGDGRLRIMEFSPQQNVIRVRTYSPWTNLWKVSADSISQFTLPCNLSGGTAFEQIGSVSVPSGREAALYWPGRRPEATYEWYVSVDDGTSRVVGPVWSLTTAENQPPVVRVVSPNGSESINAGGTFDVRWTASDNVGVTSVSIYLSKNGLSGPWSSLATNVPNTGSRTVTAPMFATTNALVRVIAKDAARNQSNDFSDAAFSLVGVVDAGEGAAIADFALGRATPNPARTEVKFEYALPSEANARLRIFDIQGRVVVTLAEGRMPAGRRQAVWRGGTSRGPARAGIYFARLDVAGRVFTSRLAWMP